MARRSADLASRRPRVLVTTQAFPPEILPAAVMADELAQGLTARGFDVTVAAGLPHHHMTELPTGYGRTFRSVEERNGYRVVRVWHPRSRSTSIAARAWVMATQALAIGVAGATSGRPDVVLSFGGPPLVGPFLSGLLAARWRVPLMTVIHDIYPDVAAETGSVKSRFLLGPARVLERAQYRLSRDIVVLSEITRNVLVTAKQLDPARVHVLPVWLDPDEIKPLPRDNAWRRAQGISPDQFVLLYAGTAGIISGAEILADVARRLPPEVVVVVVGGGKAWRALDEVARRRDAPPNLKVLPVQPRERLAEVQSASDLSILTLLPGRGRTSVPSKLQGYMAAGRPVLAAVDRESDAAALVERDEFGRVVGLDAATIASAVFDARTDAAKLARWGRMARRAFERDYAREPLIDDYASLLRAAAAGASVPELSRGPV
jgi:colanic acid biosynthesis glycosyl transferase WcaI